MNKPKKPRRESMFLRSVGHSDPLGEKKDHLDEVNADSLGAFACRVDIYLASGSERLRTLVRFLKLLSPITRRHTCPSS